MSATFRVTMSIKLLTTTSPAGLITVSLNLPLHSSTSLNVYRKTTTRIRESPYWCIAVLEWGVLEHS